MSDPLIYFDKSTNIVNNKIVGKDIVDAYIYLYDIGEWRIIGVGGTLSETTNPTPNTIPELIAIKTETDKIGGAYDSTPINANRDGNILERSEFIIAVLENQLPINTFQSTSVSPTTDAFSRFFVTLSSIDGNVIHADDIIITNATITLEQSINGGEFSISGITQPTLVKGLGYIDTLFIFASPMWVPGSIYKLTISGVEITGDIHLQSFIWSNVISSVSDIDTEVDIIMTQIIAPENNGTETYTMAQTLGRKGDTANSNITSSAMNIIRNIQSGQNCRRFKVIDVIDDTHFRSDSAYTAGNDTFKDCYAIVYQSVSS